MRIMSHWLADTRQLAKCLGGLLVDWSRERQFTNGHNVVVKYIEFQANYRYYAYLCTCLTKLNCTAEAMRTRVEDDQSFNIL